RLVVLARQRELRELAARLAQHLRLLAHLRRHRMTDLEDAVTLLVAQFEPAKEGPPVTVPSLHVGTAMMAVATVAPVRVLLHQHLRRAGLRTRVGRALRGDE